MYIYHRITRLPHQSAHLFRIRLPRTGVLDALRNRGDAALDAGTDVGDAVPKGLADPARRARDRLAHTARGGAQHAADRVCQAANRVAERRRDHLRSARDAGVVLVVGHGFALWGV